MQFIYLTLFLTRYIDDTLKKNTAFKKINMVCTISPSRFFAYFDDQFKTCMKLKCLLYLSNRLCYLLTAHKVILAKNLLPIAHCCVIILTHKIIYEK